MIKYYKFYFIFLLIIINIIFYIIKSIFLKKNIIFHNENKIPNLFSINTILRNNIDIRYNSILLLELFHYHYECSPGFSKYFIDLGYNVDIIMNKIGITSFFVFESIDKVRIFFYDYKEDIEKDVDEFKLILTKYTYILLETTEPKDLALYNNLNLANINNCIFVFHHIDYAYSLPFINRLNKCHIWTLGNFSLGTKVNPHYFGNLKLKKKNRKTKFFITSTTKRKYKFLINAAEQFKIEKLNFHIIVVGKSKVFSKKNIPEDLKKFFTFKYRITYTELYKEVSDCDYIIINLDPNNPEDVLFSKIRVTGSAQLAYGFLKPVLINENFANFYHFNSSNSFIYTNSNVIKVMRDAINLDIKYYKEMQKHLSLLSKEIYTQSLYNVKNCLNQL